MSRALFPGAFDPFTLGHLSIVRRALTIFDEVVIALGVNSQKKPYTPTSQRLEQITKLFEGDKRVRVIQYDGLTMSLAKEIGASCIIRGVRSVQDYEYEALISDVNIKIGDVETLIMVSLPEYSYISSTVVREMHRHGVDTKNLVPEGITL